MYAPPPFGYALTVCRYERTTIASSIEIATAIGPDEPRRPDARDQEDPEDLLARVRDRRQRVGREHRQGQDLGEQRVLELAAGHGAADEQPLRDASRGGRRSSTSGRCYPAGSDALGGSLADPPVADPGLGHDQLRRLRVVAELLAQRTDVGTQVGGLGPVALAPDLAQEPLVGEELARGSRRAPRAASTRWGSGAPARRRVRPVAGRGRPRASRTSARARSAPREPCAASPRARARAAPPSRTAS